MEFTKEEALEILGIKALYTRVNEIDAKKAQTEHRNNKELLREALIKRDRERYETTLSSRKRITPNPGIKITASVFATR